MEFHYELPVEKSKSPLPVSSSPQLACLGPAGTFTHTAAQKIFGDSVGYLPMAGISAVFKAVESGTDARASLPNANERAGYS